MESRTAELRKAAPEWSLAGDRNLLQVLEDIHQKLMTKCQEVNTRLDEMVNKLDNASVDLQNVNNKFIALSNSQFIESRVYDDDVISDGEQKKKTSEPVREEDELTKVKHSLQTFEKMHEAVRILDSDSSDDEDDFSTILKPKDMYSDRPLPYIIGSHQWKTKWHVGLAPSESDSDDSDSYVKRSEPREQYSESESEGERTYPKEAAHVSSNSDVESEPSPGPSGVVRPADVAAQIAQRLAAHQPPLETQSREPSVPDSGPRKVYRVEQPGTIPVFSEEPPPLDNSIDDYSDNYSDEEDIFAELHRKPSNHRPSEPRGNDPFVDQLFGDIRNERKQEKVPSSVDTSILLKNDSKANLLPQQDAAKSNETSRSEQTKKPVGGMSLFGSSQGAESIGAAILKRNQRKSSTSDDDDKAVEEKSESDLKVNPVPTSTSKIIEDLFTKPKLNKKEPIIEKAAVPAAATHKTTTKPKIDLFSDNIFDDVDDIFTSEIVTKPKETNQKSIFDEDDDDLFADVPTKTVTKDRKNKNIFDSDDELFKEDIKESTKSSTKQPVDIKTNERSKIKNTESSIFSDDSDDIFAPNNNTPKITQNQATPKIPDLEVNDIHNSNTKTKNINRVELKQNELQDEAQTASKTLKPTIQPKKFESPLLFDDDDIEDLFTSNINASKIKESKIEANKNEQVFEDESVIKVSKGSEESSEKPLTTRTDLVVNNAEPDEYLFTSTKVPIEENSNKTSDNILKITNDSNESINKQENYVAENTEQLQSPKKIIMHNEESFSKANITNLVSGTNECLPDTSTYNKTDNTLNNSATTESLISFIKQNEKQHAELDDIFNDVPPVFEKPSEPKKSKNVNALFDDDSDDEALFFRKSDVTVEKPKEMYNDDRFRIFHDEPPDVDVDFTTKTGNILDNVESDEDLFTLSGSNASNKNTQEPEQGAKLEHENVKQNEDLFTEPQDNINVKKGESLDISKLLSSDAAGLSSITTFSLERKIDSKISNNIEKQSRDIISEQYSKDTETSTKKSIGKLKPMNININVHSLLPGASPTKQKTKDESDGSALSTQSNEELNKYSSENNESKMVKSVSFDGDPGSEVLDNKLSKGRARIQVKRRPSSRRARLEAVRKSGIDFADDSTDNSSSFDEPKPVTSGDSRFSETKEVPLHTSNSDVVRSRTENTVIESNISPVNRLPQPSNLDHKVSTEIKSKTVYILHDEDIFSNSPNTKTASNSKKSLTILDDDDDEDLFKASSSKSVKNINTSEKPEKSKKDINTTVIKNSRNNIPKATKSIFDDLSDDDELFGGKKSIESSSVNVKSSTNQVKQSIKTGSLFGDDSDDDDLFKTAKRIEVKATKPKETTAVKPTAVKNDPLSFFDDS